MEGARSAGAGGGVVTFTVIDAEQRSEAWFAARLGRLTGSRAADMLSIIKSGEAAARRDLRLRLVIERITGQPQDDGYINAVMQRGVDLEPAALAAYEALTGRVVTRVGFIAHDTLMAGCSPDGLTDDGGLLELKCPKSATHLRYLRGEYAVPSEHLAQVLHNLWITGAPYCDFLSYDDRFPEALRVFYVRHERDEDAIAAYAAKAVAFLAEVETETRACLTLADIGRVLEVA